MEDKKLNNIKSKIIIIITILSILLVIAIVYFLLNKKDYKIFLETYMPKDSYGYAIYSPGNESEFNLYKGSYLNIEYLFTDGKLHDIDYIIEDKNVIAIENNKIIAKNNGTSKFYIKAKDGIVSNTITVNVVD